MSKLVLSLSLLLLISGNSDHSPPIRRMALLISSADGGPQRAILKYAQSDSHSIYNVLTELGGLEQNDVLTIHEPTPVGLDKQLDKLKTRITNNSYRRLELIIYYSGHSDENGLLFGNNTYTYEKFRSKIQALNADVRIVILDSCSSGAIARTKGGKKRAPIMLDERSQVKGLAFLTSSSEDESAQESDRIGGSFFTYFLVSGLRGAADTNQDGLVTLDEAYQFAFNETLASTVSTMAGPQHPAYDIQLAGRGELILTDVRKHSSTLVIDPEISGKIYLYGPNNKLTAELNKTSGQTMTLALAPAKYKIVLTASNVNLESSFSLEEGRGNHLYLSDFEAVSLETTTIRGQEHIRVPYSTRFLHAAIFDDPIVENARQTRLIRRNLSLSLIHGEIDALTGLALSLGTHKVHHKTNGFQQSLLLSESASLSGIQFSVGINRITYNANGLQLGVLINQAGKVSNGAQISVVANKSNVLHGLQISIGTNVTRNLKGIQSAGFLNLVDRRLYGLQTTLGLNTSAHELYGVQLSLIGNVSNYLEGLQISTITNINAKMLRGLQTATVFNYSKHIDGVQAGLVNYAKNIEGIQGGLVNSTHKLKGLQVGLVNYATSSESAQVGLVNIAGTTTGSTVGLLNFVAKGGHLDLVISTEDLGLIGIALKLGSKHVYSIIGVSGFSPGVSKYTASRLGLGIHIPISPNIYLDFEHILLHPFIDFKDSTGVEAIYSPQLTLGYSFNDSVAIFAGPAIRFLFLKKRINSPEELGFVPSWTWFNPSLNTLTWLGATAGIQFF